MEVCACVGDFDMIIIVFAALHHCVQTMYIVCDDFGSAFLEGVVQMATSKCSAPPYACSGCSLY